MSSSQAAIKNLQVSANDKKVCHPGTAVDSHAGKREARANGGSSMWNPDISEADAQPETQRALLQPNHSKSEQIRLLIVEDQPVFQDGLSTLLASQPDMLVVGQAGTFPEALAEFRRHKPDVTLMNQRLGGAASAGSDILAAIKAEFPRARIIILTTADGDVEIQRALRAGAVSYVLKSTPKSELLEIVRFAHRGRRRIPPDVAARLAEHMGKEQITAREIEVLTLIRDGNRNKQIANQLSIAETTVNFHIKNLVGKLQANDRTHAVIIAIQRGLLRH
jgi:DNA-binding NarL/FixJ family response regulator